MGSRHLGHTIKELLRQRGMRPTQLARLANIDHGQLSKIMHGKAFPSIESLRRIASALGVSPGTLLDGKIETGDELAHAVEHLAVAFYSLRQLEKDDRQSLVSMVHQVAQLVSQSPDQVEKLIGQSPGFQTERLQSGD